MDAKRLWMLKAFPRRLIEPETESLRKMLSRATPSSQRHHTVSAFSNWIFHETVGYRLDATSVTEEEQRRRRQEGQFAHRELEIALQWMRQNTAAKFEIRDWKLVHADDHAEGPQKRVFQSSRLQVDGKPLTGTPDVVLQNCATDEYLIIERKFTRIPPDLVPDSGWPNLRAQLWAYSWMDDWCHARDVCLIGQIWCLPPRVFPEGRRRRAARTLDLHVNVCPRWRRSTKGFDEPWSEFFQIYGGTIVPQ